MKDPDKSQQFNTTLIIAIVLAGLLALGVLALVYGCMKANHAPKVKPVGGAALLIAADKKQA